MLQFLTHLLPQAADWSDPQILLVIASLVLVGFSLVKKLMKYALIAAALYLLWLVLRANGYA